MSGFMGGSSDKSSGAVSHAALQQASVCSGSYAVPGVFGGQTLQHGGRSTAGSPSVSPPTAAPTQPPQAASSINGTANHKVLDNAPSLHHPPAVTSVAWGGAAMASPAVLFGQHEVSEQSFFFFCSCTVNSTEVRDHPRKQCSLNQRRIL